MMQKKSIGICIKKTLFFLKLTQAISFFVIGVSLQIAESSARCQELAIHPE